MPSTFLIYHCVIQFRNPRKQALKMSKSHFYSLLVFILSTFGSCSPDDDECINEQNALRTITVEAISELPISPMASDSGQQRFDSMKLVSGPTTNTIITGNGSETVLGPISNVISNLVPNQIGENSITQIFTAAPQSNLVIGLTRYNWLQTYNPNTSIYAYYCGDVTINVYSDNVLFHTVTKEMGGLSFECPDGTYYNFNVIVPE